MTRVKICGCRSVEQALAAAEAGADFIGLVFAASSRRRIDVEDASEIVRAIGRPLAHSELASPPAIYRSTATDHRSWFEHGVAALERMLAAKRPLTVGVFADNDPEEINETVNECGIDLIQLSGAEPWSACLLANRQVIRTVRLSGEDGARLATPAAASMPAIETGSAIAVLLDHPLPGSGRLADWRLAASISGRMPVWLAGGLDAGNVAMAIERVHPWCVDVSSGVETDGVKDAAKIRAFIAAAKP